MSSIWGGLAGLGDWAVQYGTNMSKSALADKLEQQREARAEARQIAREERDEAKVLATPVGTDYFERDGALFARSFNKYNRTVDERLASKDEIDKRNREKIKQDQDDQIRDLALSEALWKQGSREDPNSLENRLRQAQIDAVRAQTADRYASAANRGLSGSGSGGSTGSQSSPEDYALLLMKDYKAWFDEQGFASESDKIRFARDVIQQAGKTGIPAATLMMDMAETGQSSFYKPRTAGSPTGGIEIDVANMR